MRASKEYSYAGFMYGLKCPEINLNQGNRFYPLREQENRLSPLLFHSPFYLFTPFFSFSTYGQKIQLFFFCRDKNIRFAHVIWGKNRFKSDVLEKISVIPI